MKVLSLFDGMSCGMVALERAGITVDKYYASEIDKYSQIVSEKNYPNIIRLGDVTKWREWDIDFSKIDLLLAGFPCQAWSVAGKQGGVDDPRGALVHDLLDIYSEIKKQNQNVKFLFENVKMKKDSIQYINSLFGCEPVEINSALVSAQNRKRLYWCNWGVDQPADKGILLKDIIEAEINPDCHVLLEKAIRRIDRKKGFKPQIMPEKTGTLNTKNNSGQLSIDNGTTLIPVIKTHGIFKEKNNKSQCLDANYFKGPDNHGQRTLLVMRNKSQTIPATIYKENAKSMIKRKKMGLLVGKNGIKDNVEWRKLAPIECERLQTVPDGYTEGVSNTQRYKMLGNGWTIDVIAHILKQINLDNH